MCIDRARALALSSPLVLSETNVIFLKLFTDW